jgi:hypothetical protein
MRELRGLKKVLDELELQLSSEWVTIRCKQIRRCTVTSILTWRPTSETDAAALRRGWDDGAPRLVPPPTTRRSPRLPPPPMLQRIGIALVLRGNATALSASGTHGSSGEEATDIQSTCPPPDAKLAEPIMVPAGDLPPRPM